MPERANVFESMDKDLTFYLLDNTVLRAIADASDPDVEPFTQEVAL